MLEYEISFNDQVDLLCGVLLLLLPLLLRVSPRYCVALCSGLSDFKVSVISWLLILSALTRSRVLVCYLWSRIRSRSSPWLTALLSVLGLLDTLLTPKEYGFWRNCAEYLLFWGFHSLLGESERFWISSFVQVMSGCPLSLFFVDLYASL